MKKTLSFIFFIVALFFYGQNQLKVLNAVNKKPLGNASIYCEDDLIGRTNTLGILEFKTKCKKVEILANNYEAAEAEVKKLMETALKPSADKTGNIDRIVITDKSDARALKILDELNKRFKENSPKSLESYQFTGYSKLSIDVDRDSVEAYKGFMAKRNDSLAQVKKTVKTDKKTKDSLRDQEFTNTLSSSQMFLWEKATRYLYAEKYGEKTVIEDNRMSGFQNPLYEFLSVNVSNLNRLPRPVSPENRKIYRYYLSDSIQLDGRLTYVVKYKEINNKTRQNPRKFNGYIYVDAENYALKKIESNSKKLNEGNVVSVWKPINNKWFLDYEDLRIRLGDMSFDTAKKDSTKAGEKPKSVAKKFGNYLYVKNRFYDFQTNTPQKAEDYKSYALEVKNADGKKLQQYRTDSLTAREGGTYQKLDSFVQKYNFDKRISLFTNLLKGNLRYRKVDFDLSRILDYNKQEGIRLGVGAKLNETFSKNFSPDAYFGYGFKDHKWKYGAGIDVILSKKRTSIIRLETMDDVFAIGRLRRSFMNAALKYVGAELDLNNFNFYRQRHWAGSYTYDFSNSLSAKIILSREIQNALFAYQYRNLGNEFTNFNTTLSLKYAPKDKNMMTPAGKYTFERGFPYFFLNYERGSEFLGGKLDYHRIDASAIHQFRNKLGTTSLKLFGGLSSGTAPIWKNFEITGQMNGVGGRWVQNYSTISNIGMVTMPSGTYYADRFLALQVSQLLPFQFKTLGKRFSTLQLEYQSAIGGFRNPQDHQFGFKVLNRYYHETGLLWNKFLGTNLDVGFSYRLGHYQTSEFKNNFGIQLRLSSFRF